MSDETNYFEVNKDTWNKKVAIHAQSEMYDLEAFKLGKCSLMPYEKHALGDVRNKSLLHLQCHFGQDTLSWTRLGAKTVGVDISDEAIKLARQLNTELDLNAKFVCCNVLETSQHVHEHFDIVFTSYGVIGWLPDLKPWAKTIAERLKPGGFFYMVEFHPIVWMFDYTTENPEMKYHYNQDEVIYEEYEGTYTDNPLDGAPSKMVSKEYGWNHGLSEVINALLEAGLTLSFLNEYDESPYNVLPDLVKTSNDMYRQRHALYPLIFELKATKEV
jgi:SAM-dependent methyltransferase